MHTNLNELLKRGTAHPLDFVLTLLMRYAIIGESLDSLMTKSKDLSTVSVEFYKKAKKKNQQCCKMS